MHIKNPSYAIFRTIAFLSFFLFSLSIYATASKDPCVFVILTHVRNLNDEIILNRCYSSVREFYPNLPIVIINDNSKVNINNFNHLSKTTIVDSEFPGAGELLPYYYYLKYKWADKMVFLHDSMLLKRKFKKSELNTPIKFHWHFDVWWFDDDKVIDHILSYLPLGKEWIELNHQKSSWMGCFGVASIIDLELLERFENQYAFTSSLITQVNNRDHRMALERIFGMLMCHGEYVDMQECSNFGTIFAYPGNFRPVNDVYLDFLKISYPGAILKTWHGR